MSLKLEVAKRSKLRMEGSFESIRGKGIRDVNSLRLMKGREKREGEKEMERKREEEELKRKRSENRDVMRRIREEEERRREEAEEEERRREEAVNEEDMFGGDDSDEEVRGEKEKPRSTNLLLNLP